MYQYHATVLRIVDGDTVELNIDLGMKIFYKSLCRLSGINSPELNSPDETVRAAAISAKLYLANILLLNSVVLLDSKGLDKYGRPLGVITTSLGVNINNAMLASGNAVVY